MTGELLCHLIGDYVLQNRWMAHRKVESLPVALLHATLYGLPFLALRPGLGPLLWIVLSHALIDRYNVARYLVWAKEHLAPRAWRPPPLARCPTGNDPSVPPHLADWLRILVDNTLHLVLNHAALTIFS
jgi:hypothetical protein